MLTDFCRRIVVIAGAIESMSDHRCCDFSLNRLWIPAQIELIKLKCFKLCQQLEWTVFETNSRLMRIEKEAFTETGLLDIVIPLSVEVIEPRCFYRCKSLLSVTFESGSRLLRIEDSAFEGPGLSEIVISSSADIRDPIAVALSRWRCIHRNASFANAESANSLMAVHENRVTLFS
jgi:hypothetical protein